jgi:uroporphyrinogen decarboxylase
MKQFEAEGFCKVDEKNKVVYDSWGMGVKIGEDGFFSCFHPIQKKLDKDFVKKWMPERIHKACLADTLKERVKYYTAPDPLVEGNFDPVVKVNKDFGNDLYVIPSGYFGLYERAYGLTSIPTLFESFLLEPVLVGNLLDIIAEYRIKVAEKYVEIGFPCGHLGDDLGTQVGPFFSPKIFKDLIAPRYKQIWSVYKKAGMPVALHSCGHITNFIPDLIDLGLDILNPVQPCMDHKYLKAEYGKDLTFWGGIDTQYILPHGTLEEVRKCTLEVMETLGKGGGLIVAPSQEIMNDVPLENIVAMLETIVENRARVANS